MVDAEQMRTTGPAVVWAGPNDAPAVVVLDPAVAGNHGELPATWRPLVEHVQVMWVRLPAADDPWREVGELLEEFTQRDLPVHVVTSGPVVEVALGVATAHRGLLRSVLLVDPEVDPAAHDRDLVKAGVQVRVVARSHDGPTDRIDPPLPLGHPEVVLAVIRALLALDTESGTPGRDPAATTSLVGDAASALWQAMSAVLERLR